MKITDVDISVLCGPLHRKASSIAELIDHETYTPVQFLKENLVRVQKIVELPREEFHNWGKNLCKDVNFIGQFSNTNVQYLYVKEEGKNWGVVVDHQGYTYARYTAIYREPDQELDEDYFGVA